MSETERIVVSAKELVRAFSHFSEIALSKPVVVTKNGRARQVLISIEEYEQLKERDREVFLAAETPPKFLAGIEALAGKKL